MKTLLIAFGACLAASAHAEPVQCSGGEMRPITSIATLPDDVQLLLGRGNSGVGGIADAKEAFNASDAISAGEVLPMSRFNKASLGEDCVTVIVERGGIAHHFEALVFRKEKLAWRLAGKRAASTEELQPPQAQQATP
jgi:hypothetical protein